ncbi:MAG: hypothetical protein WCV92_00205 [Candidatus Buchananbacteria bacterium]
METHDNNLNFMAPEPSDGLFYKIINRIEEEKKLRKIRKKIIYSSLLFSCSLIAVVPAIISLWTNLDSSGFNSFASLLFSDSGMIFVYWQSFSLALLETLPVINLILVLAVAMGILTSLRFLFKNIKKINSLKFA